MALVGKPNVGKSSLLNKLAGDQRSVVHEAAGTTVDPVDSLIELGGDVWRFVDTAGLRRKVGQASGHEFYASVRTHAAIDSAEVAIVLIDASQPLTEQDLRVISMVIEAGRALVLAYNKWDLVDEDRRELLQREIDRAGAGALGATGQHLRQDGPGGAQAGAGHGGCAGVMGHQDRDRPAEHLAHRGDGGHTAAGARRQAATHLVRDPGHRAATDVRVVHHGFLEAGYRRFLERRLRETFGFDGSPIRVNVRVREKRAGKRR